MLELRPQSALKRRRGPRAVPESHGYRITVQPGVGLRFVDELSDTCIDNFVDLVVRFFWFEIVMSRMNVFLDVSRC
jgi:hypothetical protein